jgi:hypothetical protein
VIGQRHEAHLLIGIFGISLIENVLRPLILSRRTSVSGLVIFFGLLGGAAALGLLGLLIGRIILVTTARLFDELRRSDVAEEPARSHEGESGKDLTGLSPGRSICPGSCHASLARTRVDRCGRNNRSSRPVFYSDRPDASLSSPPNI